MIAHRVEDLTPVPTHALLLGQGPSGTGCSAWDYGAYRGFESGAPPDSNLLSLPCLCRIDVPSADDKRCWQMGGHEGPDRQLLAGQHIQRHAGSRKMESGGCGHCVACSGRQDSCGDVRLKPAVVTWTLHPQGHPRLALFGPAAFKAVI